MNQIEQEEFLINEMAESTVNLGWDLNSTAIQILAAPFFMTVLREVENTIESVIEQDALNYNNEESDLVHSCFPRYTKEQIKSKVLSKFLEKISMLFYERITEIEFYRGVKHNAAKFGHAINDNTPT